MILDCAIVNCYILRKRSMKMTTSGYILKMFAAIIVFTACICILYFTSFTVNAASLLGEDNLSRVCTESYETEDFSSCLYHCHHVFNCPCLIDISSCNDNYPIKNSSRIYCVDWSYAEKCSYGIFKPPKK